VVGSDGLFDNLYPNQIKSSVEEVIKGLHKFSPTLIADRLANLTGKFAQDEGYMSPFSEKAREQGHRFMTGGKVDDIAIVIGRVNLVETNQDRMDKAGLGSEL